MLLKQSSEYFKGLFRSATEENESAKVTLKETTEEAVDGFVHFVYAARLPPSCRKTPGIVDTFVLANRWTDFCYSFVK